MLIMSSSDDKNKINVFEQFRYRHRLGLNLCLIIFFPIVILGLFVILTLFFQNFQYDDPTVTCRDLFDESVIHTVTFLDVEGNEYKSYKVRHGDCIGETPEYSEAGYVFVRWDVPSYCNLDISEFPIGEDMEISPVCTDLSLVAINVIAIADPNNADTNPDSLREFINQVESEVQNESQE